MKELQGSEFDLLEDTVCVLIRVTFSYLQGALAKIFPDHLPKLENSKGKGSSFKNELYNPGTCQSRKTWYKQNIFGEGRECPKAKG